VMRATRTVIFIHDGGCLGHLAVNGSELLTVRSNTAAVVRTGHLRATSFRYPLLRQAASAVCATDNAQSS